MTPGSGDSAASPGIAAESDAPSLPSATLEALRTAPDSLRRCFICLTDEDPSDPPSAWVDACPCTLTAHQDCALSWVTDCERSNKPLLCPVCKYKVELEDKWDPLVAINDAVSRRFTRASPFMLFTGMSLGVHLCLHAYGVLALWAFSGEDVAMKFVLGRHKFSSRTQSSISAFARDRVGDSMILINVAPALLLGNLLPGFSNKIFMPSASLYGAWHAMHDEHFLSWPPSPQLALALFPYVRSVYYHLWKELVYPFETRLNRQILGLPQPDPNQAAGRANNNNRRNDRNGDGIMAQVLQTLIDALDTDEDDNGDDHGLEELEVDNAAQNQGVVLDVEVVIEDVAAEEEVEEAVEQLALEVAAEGGNANPQVPGGAGQGPAAADVGVQAVPEAPADNAQPGQHNNHEVPPARPARRPTLGSVLASFSNSITTALILPGISYAMGEALRLVLPRPWTAAPLGTMYRFGPLGRPGLLHQRWGRSLVGGCLFVVMRDALRLYVKYRKATAMANRKVKNVDRRRERR